MKVPQKKKNFPEQCFEAVKAYNEVGISTDPNGSYTGVTRETKYKNGKIFRKIENDDLPVQDADDL